MEVKIDGIIQIDIPVHQVLISFESSSQAEGFVDWLMDEEDNEQGKRW